MPINTNHWTTYIQTITNHQHLLAHQLIKAYNQEFKLVADHQKLGYSDDNQLKRRLTTHLKIQTVRITKQWQNNLRPPQQRQWQHTINQLTNTNQIFQQVAEIMCFKPMELQFDNYQKYYQKHHNHLPQPSAIKKMADLIIFLEQSFDHLIQSRKDPCPHAD